MTGNGTVSHGSGSNLANDPPPLLPVEPIRTEDPDAFRRRMEAKAARQRGFAEDTVKGYAAREAARRAQPAAEVLEQERQDGFTAPDVAPEPKPEAPKPVARPRRVPDETVRRNARIVSLYVEDGLSQYQIATEVGLSQPTVGTILRAAGVQTRPFSRSSRRVSPEPTPSKPPAAPSAPAPLSSPPREEPDPVPDVEPTFIPLAPAADTGVDVAGAAAAMRAAVQEVTLALDAATSRWLELALARDLAVYERLGTLRAATTDLLDLITDQPERNAS